MPSEQELLADFQAKIKAAPPYTPIHAPALRVLPPADDPAAEDRAAAMAARNRRASIEDALAYLTATRGVRYRDCRLANFQVTDDLQREAITVLRDYCRSIRDHVAAGRGLFLFGPCGTGKDHLAMGVAHAFIQATAGRVEWTSGARLFERLRDTIGDGALERDVLRPLRTAPLLWISDPIPVRGEFTGFQSEKLYSVFDERYNAGRPIIVTANMEPGTGNDVFGFAIARRLRDATIAVHCNWTPYGQGKREC
jgi:DNA replication protein DnaC